MIRIRGELANGRAVIEANGHEGHVEQGVVCAAVSAIIQTALLGLAEVARQNPDLVSITIEEE